MKTGTKRTDIKSILPHGSIKEIANRCGVTIFTVSRVVNGHSNNTKVKRGIADYLNELAEMEESIANKSKALLT